MRRISKEYHGCDSSFVNQKQRYLRFFRVDVVGLGLADIYIPAFSTGSTSPPVFALRFYIFVHLLIHLFFSHFEVFYRGQPFFSREDFPLNYDLLQGFPPCPNTVIVIAVIHRIHTRSQSPESFLPKSSTVNCVLCVEF